MMRYVSCLCLGAIAVMLVWRLTYIERRRVTRLPNGDAFQILDWMDNGVPVLGS